MECSRCPYGRYPKIPPSLIQPAELAIVGEAPGTTEIARKRPFVGPSGKLLGMALKVAGIESNTTVFITNSMLCRPPSGKPISREAIELCRGRLLDELRQVKPKIVIALGNTAIHALTGDYKLKITAIQGKAINSPYLDALIVAAFHPAKILRTPGDYRTFQNSIDYAIYLLKGGKPKNPGETTYVVVDKEEDVPKAIEYLSKFEEMSCDIETTGLRFLKDRIILMGLCPKKNETRIFTSNVIPLLKDLFANPNIAFIWQNGKFDTSFLRMIGIPARIDHDIMLQHYALNENPPHDLGYLASTILGAEAYKDEMSKYKKVGFDKAPKETLHLYQARDADYTYQIHRQQIREVESDPDAKKLYYDLLLPASRFLRRVQRNGIYPDVEYLHQLEAELSKEKEELEVKIQELFADAWDPEQYMRDTNAKTAPDKLNPASPKQLSWLIYDQLQLLKARRDKSVDEDVLVKIKDEHPAIPYLLNFRKVSKMLSTYVTGMFKHIDFDGRVHTTYLIHGTVTGRLSSRQPNLQNIPGEPKFRNIFIAPPGRRLLEADYKSAELRVLAMLSGDKFLSSVFREGRDLHTEVAIALFGPGFTRDQRLRAKAINFGIAYGRKPYSIAEEFNIDVSEAEQMIEDWFARMPQAKAYLESCDEAAKRGETLVTPFGRKRRFGLISFDNLEDLQNEARNFKIQSIASDLTLFSAMAAERPLREYDAKIINLVHDSILIEIPDDDMMEKEVAKLITSTMSRIPKEKLNTDIPFVADVKTGYKWGSLQEIEV